MVAKEGQVMTNLNLDVRRAKHQTQETVPGSLACARQTIFPWREVSVTGSIWAYGKNFHCTVHWPEYWG